MVVIMQSKEKFFQPAILAYTSVDYSQFLISGLAIDSSLFIISAAAMVNGGAYWYKVQSLYSLVNLSMRIAFIGLLILLPLLLVPFSIIGAVVTSSIEVIWYYMYKRITPGSGYSGL